MIDRRTGEEVELKNRHNRSFLPNWLSDRAARPDPKAATALGKWTEISDRARHKCVELVRPFSEATDELSAPLESGALGLDVSTDGYDNEFKTKTSNVIEAWMSGMMPVGTVGLVLNTAFQIAVPPLGLAAIPVLYWLGKRGHGKLIAKEVEKAEWELENRLRGFLTEVNGYFFKPDSAAGRSALVEEYFNALGRAVDEQVQGTLEQKNREFRTEVARLNEAFQMGEGERKAKAQEVRRQLAEWDEIAATIKDLTEQILATSGRPLAATPR